MSPDNDLYGWPRPQPSPLMPALPPAPPPRSRMNVVPLSVVFWLLPLQLAITAAGLLTWRIWIDPPYKPRIVDPRGDLAADEKSTIAMYNLLRPSVVHVTTLTDGDDE